MEPQQFMALMIPIIGISIPVVAIVTSYRLKLEEIKARAKNGLSDEVRAELSEMKRQLADLRETTTKFDMSFDAALSRMEERLERVEERQGVPAAAASGDATISVGRG